MNEQDTVNGTNADVRKIFAAVYEAQADAVFRYCLMRTSNREMALDLTQEAFTRFWEALPKYATADSHRAVLFTIAKHLVIDWYRKKKSLSLEAISENADVEVDFALSGTVREELERSAEARLLAEKIALLEPSYRHVVYLRFVEDLKPQEIAAVVGESVNVVSVRISRGMDKLRALISGADTKQHE